jgi:hypothetical protein
MATKAACSNCGELADVTSEVCPHCGDLFVPEKEPKPAADFMPALKIGAGLVALAAIVGGIYVYSVGQSATKTCKAGCYSVAKVCADGANQAEVGRCSIVKDDCLLHCDDVSGIKEVAADKSQKDYATTSLCLELCGKKIESCAIGVDSQKCLDLISECNAECMK